MAVTAPISDTSIRQASINNVTNTTTSYLLGSVLDQVYYKVDKTSQTISQFDQEAANFVDQSLTNAYDYLRYIRKKSINDNSVLLNLKNNLTGGGDGKFLRAYSGDGKADYQDVSINYIKAANVMSELNNDKRAPTVSAVNTLIVQNTTDTIIQNSTKIGTSGAVYNFVATERIRNNADDWTNGTYNGSYYAPSMGIIRTKLSPLFDKQTDGGSGNLITEGGLNNKIATSTGDSDSKLVTLGIAKKINQITRYDGDVSSQFYLTSKQVDFKLNGGTTTADRKLMAINSNALDGVLQQFCYMPNNEGYSLYFETVGHVLNDGKCIGFTVPSKPIFGQLIVTSLRIRVVYNEKYIYEHHQGADGKWYYNCLNNEKLTTDDTDGDKPDEMFKVKSDGVTPTDRIGRILVANKESAVGGNSNGGPQTNFKDRGAGIHCHLFFQNKLTTTSKRDASPVPSKSMVLITGIMKIKVKKNNNQE